jgi:hypothetical protein
MWPSIPNQFFVTGWAPNMSERPVKWLGRMGRRFLRRLSPAPMAACERIADAPRILVPRTIVLTISGGLCNQLMCYSAARRLASIYDAQIIAFSSTFQAKDHTRLMLERYSPKFAMLTDSNFVIDSIMKSCEGVEFTTVNLFREDGSVASPEAYEAVEIDMMASPVVRIGFDLALYYFRSDCRKFGLTPEIREELQLSEAGISASSRAILKQIKANRNSVAVHIRRGDFLSRDNDLAVSPEYYKRACEMLSARIPDCFFFVFSDDAEWAREVFGKRERLVVVDKRGFEDAPEDLFLASKCRHFILTNHSTFSHWMVSMSSENEERVIITNSVKWLITSRTLATYFAPARFEVV